MRHRHAFWPQLSSFVLILMPRERRLALWSKVTNSGKTRSSNSCNLCASSLMLLAA